MVYGRRFIFSFFFSPLYYREEYEYSQEYYLVISYVNIDTVFENKSRLPPPPPLPSPQIKNKKPKNCDLLRQKSEQDSGETENCSRKPSENYVMDLEAYIGVFDSPAE